METLRKPVKIDNVGDVIIYRAITDTEGTPVVLCDMCNPTMDIEKATGVFEGTLAEALAAGWEEVEYGVECLPCIEKERAQEALDEEQGAISVVGTLPGMQNLIATQVSPEEEGMARHALKNGAKTNETGVTAIALPAGLVGQVDAAETRVRLVTEYWEKHKVEITEELQSKIDYSQGEPGLATAEHKAAFDKWVSRAREYAGIDTTPKT